MVLWLSRKERVLRFKSALDVSSDSFRARLSRFQEWTVVNRPSGGGVIFDNVVVQGHA